MFVVDDVEIKGGGLVFVLGNFWLVRWFFYYILEL